MLSLSETNLTLTIPPISTIPFLSELPIPKILTIPTTETTLIFPLETLKTTLRIVVIISTYLLFRPHLEKIFRTITNRPNAEELDLKERMEFIKNQQAQVQSSLTVNKNGGGGSVLMGGGNKSKKVVAVATPGGSNGNAIGSSTPSTPASEKGKSGTRRKA